MLNILKRNKVPTLYQKKAIVNNDINIEEYDPMAIMTLILIPTLFLISMKLFMSFGCL